MSKYCTQRRKKSCKRDLNAQRTAAFTMHKVSRRYCAMVSAANLKEETSGTKMGGVAGTSAKEVNRRFHFPFHLGKCARAARRIPCNSETCRCHMSLTRRFSRTTHRRQYIPFVVVGEVHEVGGVYMPRRGVVPRHASWPPLCS